MLTLAYYIELYWLLVDSVSGYLLNKGMILPGDQSLGSITRMGVLLLFFLIVLKYCSAKKNVPLLLLVLIMEIVLFHGISNHGEGIIADYQFQIKLLLPILFYYVMRIQLQQGVLNNQKIHKIVLLNSFTMLTNLYMSVFGFGFSNYGETAEGGLIGGKGFFFAGNEVNITLTVLFALMLLLYGDRLRTKFFSLLSLLAVFFIASVLLFSKTAILSFVLVSLFALIFYIPSARKFQSLILLGLTLVATSGFWMKFIEGAIDRWQYFYDRSPTFFYFLTSSRSGRIDELVRLYTEEFSTLQMLLGRGWAGIYGPLIFENDVYDLLVCSGIVGVLVYGVWMWWLKILVTRFFKTRSTDSLLGTYSLLIIVFISILAGHVLYSSMLAPFIALMVVIAQSLHAVGNAKCKITSDDKTQKTEYCVLKRKNNRGIV